MEFTNLILEMQERLIKLEKEVAALKNQAVQQAKSIEEMSAAISANRVAQGDIGQTPKTRNKTRYMFRGNVYLKNHLVFAVVRAYVNEGRALSRDDLRLAFPKSLQGSLGVVENLEVAKQRSDYRTRFFAEEDEILHLSDGDAVVCSQWGIMNIPKFLEQARRFGYEIEEIE